MSIRLRLLLWYGTLFAVILLIVALFSYALHSRGHYDDLDRALVTSAQLSAVATAAGSQQHLVGEHGGLEITVHRYSPSGTLQESSPGAPAQPAIDPQAVLAT